MPHQLPNGTQANPLSINLSINSHADADSHRALVRISPGYSLIRGMLHTRYAPIRRSPPRYCYLALPLDLHVLSLSLAFILSQDQTLHCYFIFQFRFPSNRCVSRFIFRYSFTQVCKASQILIERGSFRQLKLAPSLAPVPCTTCLYLRCAPNQYRAQRPCSLCL